MNNPQPEKPSARSGQQPGAHESPESIETFAQRTKRPGKVGLANESRPGLGTRGQEPENKTAKVTKAGIEPDEDTNEPPPEERHEPEEQDPNSFEQEEQRDTGVSGHSGGT